MRFAELDIRSNFSFLEGASHPGELAVAAQVLGLSAIGIADRNTLAGVVRAHVAAKEVGIRLLIGCRLQFTDGNELIVYPRGRVAYGRLCRLLSLGKAGIVGEGSADPTIAKGACLLNFAQAVAHGEGLVALVPTPAVIDAGFAGRLAQWRRDWPDTLYLAAAPLMRGEDRARRAQLRSIAESAGVAIVASNAVLYHHPERRMLQDVLTCVRHKTTIDAAGFVLEANAERQLKSPEEMARLFEGDEDALARTLEIVAACTFSVDELSYVYPEEPVPPGSTPDRHLARLAIAGLRTRFPAGPTRKVVATLVKELRLIRRVRYAAYFLTVHDIVVWARAPGREILCQGRGSAANSVVCYCLGVTAVNPAEQDVLFERFISAERQEPPDIDVDFEHERREEVIQYLYARYGRHRAAICATVIHYRPRSAIRDVGKVLGLTEDVTAVLASTVWGSFGSRIENDHVDASGVRRDDRRVALALQLSEQLIGFPRHLSQHVGGFILTQGPLIETVPIGNGAMADRTFIEWDKDDIDALKIMKVDVLALGMLTAIRKAFTMIEAAYGPKLDLDRVPRERARVYDMLCRADSLGVFQVESRAQMNMLPRLRPRVFYDLVVEVAIVRPGPIQGEMVHPYLQRRRKRREQGAKFRIDFPAPSPEHGDPDELKRVLHKTLGVPLFQEQAMRIAMEAAKFSGDEANGLRRAMATFRSVGTIGLYERMMVDRMVARGYPAEFANNCFNQIKGFGEYGFPESHAASFARLVYISSWLKCVFPEVFAASLLNSQPMGFYAPAQIVRDAREHGIEVRAPDVNFSDWDCTLERRERGRRRALRLGLRSITGFREVWAEAISAAREGVDIAVVTPAQAGAYHPISQEMGPRLRGGDDVGAAFTSVEDLRRRAALPREAIDALADADAFGSLDYTRREALWQSRALPRAPKAGPLFAFAGIEESDGGGGAVLPVAPASEEVVADYETIRLSLKGHPVGHLRGQMAARGAVPCSAVATMREGRRATAAGVVLVRQRPGSAKGVAFITLEDETGIANIVVWPTVFEKFRPVVMGARLLLVRGRVQWATDAGAPGVVHIVAETLEDITPDLSLLAARPVSPTAMRDNGGAPSPDRGEGHDPARHCHPRDVRVFPRSRDFH